ncbi:MAG: hypothetical protein HYX68_04645 [Planctomycetes bacterium]|nr:hypothetical protein [Planctomycetota bacterium]
MISSLAQKLLASALGVAITAVTIGCRTEQAEVLSMDLPIIVKHDLQTIHVNGWKIQRWVAPSSGSVGVSVDVWIRVTPLGKSQKLPPNVIAQLKLRHNDPKISRDASVSPIFQECSKMPKRIEYARWGQDCGPEEKFPPKELCWESTIKDPFRSNTVMDPGATRLSDGAYDLDVTVDLGLEKVKPFVFSPIRININSKRRR